MNDVRKMLKKEMASQNAIPNGYLYGINKAASNYKHIGFGTTKLYLDSVYGQITANSIRFAIQHMTTSHFINNCIGIKIKPFLFPNMAGNDAQPNPWMFKKAYLLIPELPATQVYYTSNGQKYHWELDVEILNNKIVNMTPVHEFVVFETPIESISQITLQFLLPPFFTPISIPPQINQATTVANSNPGAVLYTGTVSDTVIFIDSGSVLYNPRGFNVQTTSTGFTVPYDLSNAPAFPVRFIIPENRIAMQFDFITLREGFTNYIKPVQI